VYQQPSDHRFRFKLIPLLLVIVMGVGIPYLGLAFADLSAKWLHTPARGPGYPLGWLYIQHVVQFLFALLAIWILKKWFVPADYGMHWPRQKTYILPAVLWAVFFGVLMTVVDFTPQILAHTKPDLGYPLTTSNVTGWLFFEWVFVGPTEEVPFRALLVTYLIATMPGKFRLGRFEMSWAGVLIAVIFALLHASNFATRPWPQALGQQFYAVALGVLYAYWQEKSRSVVAASISHNVGDGVEFAIEYVWVGFL
jgi:CAAX prenyl protease-like protein